MLVARCMRGSRPIPGSLEAVRSSVVDARFEDHIPSIFHLLRAGDEGSVIVEVISHLDARTIRGIALTPTGGSARLSSDAIPANR